MWARLQPTSQPAAAYLILVYRYGGTHIWCLQDEGTRTRLAFALGVDEPADTVRSRLGAFDALPASIAEAGGESGEGEGDTRGGYMGGTNDSDSESSVGSGGSESSHAPVDGITINEVFCLSSPEGYGTPQLVHVVSSPSPRLSLDAHVAATLKKRADRRRHSAIQVPGAVKERPSSGSAVGSVVAALRSEKERSISEESIRSSGSGGGGVDAPVDTSASGQHAVDDFAAHRPLIAVAVRRDSKSRSKRSDGQPHKSRSMEVLLYSGTTRKYIHSLKFRSPICGLHSTALALVVVCMDTIYGFCNHTLSLVFRLPCGAHPFGDGFTTVALTNFAGLQLGEKGDLIAYAPHAAALPVLEHQAHTSAVSSNDGTDAPASLSVAATRPRVWAAQSASTAGPHASSATSNSASSTGGTRASGAPSLSLAGVQVPEARDMFKEVMSTAIHLKDRAIDTLVSAATNGSKAARSGSHASVGSGMEPPPAAYCLVVANILQVCADFAIWRSSSESMAGGGEGGSGSSTTTTSSSGVSVGATSTPSDAIVNQSAIPFVPRARIVAKSAQPIACVTLDTTGHRLAWTDTLGQAAHVSLLHFAVDARQRQASLPSVSPLCVCERGITTARITRLNFSIGSCWLSLTSDHGTVHTYALPIPQSTWGASAPTVPVHGSTSTAAAASGTVPKVYSAWKCHNSFSAHTEDESSGAAVPATTDSHHITSTGLPSIGGFSGGAGSTPIAPPGRFMGYGAALVDTLADMRTRNLAKVGYIADPTSHLAANLLVACDSMLIGDYSIALTKDGRLIARELAATAVPPTLPTPTLPTTATATLVLEGEDGKGTLGVPNSGSSGERKLSSADTEVYTAASQSPYLSGFSAMLGMGYSAAVSGVAMASNGIAAIRSPVTPAQISISPPETTSPLLQQTRAAERTRTSVSSGTAHAVQLVEHPGDGVNGHTGNGYGGTDIPELRLPPGNAALADTSRPQAATTTGTTGSGAATAAAYMSTVAEGVARFLDDPMAMLSSGEPQGAVGPQLTALELGSWDIRRQSHWPDIWAPQWVPLIPRTAVVGAKKLEQTLARCTSIDSEALHHYELANAASFTAATSLPVARDSSRGVAVASTTSAGVDDRKVPVSDVRYDTGSSAEATTTLSDNTHHNSSVYPPFPSVDAPTATAVAVPVALAVDAATEEGVSGEEYTGAAAASSIHLDAGLLNGNNPFGPSPPPPTAPEVHPRELMMALSMVLNREQAQTHGRGKPNALAAGGVDVSTVDTLYLPFSTTEPISASRKTPALGTAPSFDPFGTQDDVLSRSFLMERAGAGRSVSGGRRGHETQSSVGSHSAGAALPQLAPLPEGTDEAFDSLQAQLEMNDIAGDEVIPFDSHPYPQEESTAYPAPANDVFQTDVEDRLDEFDEASDAPSTNIIAQLEACQRTGQAPSDAVVDELFLSQRFDRAALTGSGAPRGGGASVLLATRMHASTSVLPLPAFADDMDAWYNAADTDSGTGTSTSTGAGTGKDASASAYLNSAIPHYVSASGGSSSATGSHKKGKGKSKKGKH